MNFKHVVHVSFGKDTQEIKEIDVIVCSTGTPISKESAIQLAIGRVQTYLNLGERVFDAQVTR